MAGRPAFQFPLLLPHPQSGTNAGPYPAATTQVRNLRATKSRSSSVGILARLSLWRMDSTFVGALFFLAMGDFLCCLCRRFQKAADEILCIPRVGDFDKRPPAETAVVIDRWDPQRLCRRDLGDFVFFFRRSPRQSDSKDRPGSVVDASYEIGDIVPLFTISPRYSRAIDSAYISIGSIRTLAGSCRHHSIDPWRKKK